MSNSRRREVVRLSDVFRKIAGMWHGQDAMVAAAANAAADKEGQLITGQFRREAKTVPINLLVRARAHYHYYC
jgi:hypothetical protein